MVEIGSRHLGEQRFEFGSGVGGHSPLDKAEITGAQRGKLAREPGLLLDPRDGGQPVVVLVAAVAKLASRPGGAAAALDQHLVAALGVGQRHHAPDKATPAIRGADQQHRGLWSGAWGVMVREQDCAIGHGDRDVACDHDIPRLGRWKLHPPGHETASKTHRVPSCSWHCARLFHCIIRLSDALLALLLFSHHLANVPHCQRPSAATRYFLPPSHRGGSARRVFPISRARS